MMSTTIGSIVHGMNVWKKESDQRVNDKDNPKNDDSQVRDPSSILNSEDKVEIQSSVRETIETNQAGSETSIKDVEEAEKLLQDVIGIMNSGDSESELLQVFNLRQSSLMQIL